MFGKQGNPNTCRYSWEKGEIMLCCREKQVFLEVLGFELFIFQSKSLLDHREIGTGSQNQDRSPYNSMPWTREIP